MELFDDEETIWTGNSGEIVVTNFRLRYTKKGATRKIQSVLLPQILQCSYTRTHHPLLLALAIFFFLGFFIRSVPHPIVNAACAALAIVFGLFYVATMKLKIVMHTSTQPILIPVGYSSSAFAEELINAVEGAIIEATNKELAPQKIRWPGA